MNVDRRKFLTYTGAAGAATGALWIAPSVVGSSTAFAAGSQCGPYTLRWADYAGTGSTAGPVLGSHAVGNITATVSQTFYGGSASYSPGSGQYNIDHGVVTATAGSPHGGYNSGSFVQLYQSAVTGGGREFVVSFSAPVKSLVFRITDIDYSRNQYDDRVIISTSAGTMNWNRTVPSGSDVRGFGGSNAGASPADTTSYAFYNQSQGNINDPNVGGSVQVNMTSPVTSVTIDFRNGTRATNGHHAIWVGDLSFDTCP